MKSFNSGTLIRQLSYKSFEPTPINRIWEIDDMELINLLGTADRALGKLDAYADYVPNIDLFLQMHALKEATQSSRIEGTQTTLDEALMNKEFINLDQRNDWQEVHNYTQALHFAIQKLQTPAPEGLPFSTRLIRETHKILLQGVRGEHKEPGFYRTSQNWIGGASLKDAVFIPPHPNGVPELMGDWEQFAHNSENQLPELLKAALLHYQFETIHPFLDGNGRVGRVSIVLYLLEKGILKKPTLYLSDFLERNRRTYYDNLMEVREKSHLLRWFKFFLVGVIETAKKGEKIFDAILQLQKKLHNLTQTLGKRASNAQKIIAHLYQNPLIEAKEIPALIQTSLPTAYALLNELVKLGILLEDEQHKGIYKFEPYIQIFR